MHPCKSSCPEIRSELLQVPAGQEVNDTCANRLLRMQGILIDRFDGPNCLGVPNFN